MNDIVKLQIRVGGHEGRTLSVKGRDAWALDALLRAGERGVTPIERPAPRWSQYIFKLRRAGLVVETIDEPHAGAYSGHHGRYVLRSDVEVLEEERAA
jgi:hypothetical protein